MLKKSNTAVKTSEKDLTHIAKAEGDHGQNDKVCSAGEIGDVVELAGACDQVHRQLEDHCYDGRQSQVVLVRRDYHDPATGVRGGGCVEETGATAAHHETFEPRFEHAKFLRDAGAVQWAQLF